MSADSRKGMARFTFVGRKQMDIDRIATDALKSRIISLEKLTDDLERINQRLRSRIEKNRQDHKKESEQLYNIIANQMDVIRQFYKKDDEKSR